jgi:lipid II:glycine glycyltransferase (peptidoglycan interpeptide bridge formation enzyme)
MKNAGLSEEAWDQFVIRHDRAHILQTTPWGELKAAFGWTVQRVALISPEAEPVCLLPEELCPEALIGGSEGVIAGAQILYRRIGGLIRLAYVPRGPLVDWEDGETAEQILLATAQAARERGAIALTVEPDLPDEHRYRRQLSALGFVPSPLGHVQPRRTLIVDLSEGEDAILAGMKSKTRYNVRLAGRRGVTVREAAERDLPIFHRLMSATADRDQFAVHSPAYYEKAFELFVPCGWARLLLAEVEGQAVAALMVFILGRRSWYFYGASSNVHREKMPTYLLQWEAMRWARSRSSTVYDLWGVPDEDKEKLEAEFAGRSDGLWGVYRFKRGFGGDLTRTIGAWDLPLRPRLYRLYTWAVRRRRPVQG